LWFLLNLPWGVENQEDSYYGQFSAAIAPVMEPAGFGSYETSGALITGFIAKEMVVSTLSQVYTGEDLAANARASSSTFGEELIGIIAGFAHASADALRTLISLIPGVNLLSQNATENTALSQALRTNFTPLSAVAFLVFVLLYVPCMATIGAIKQEFGGRWATSAAIYQTVVAWLFAVLVFQGGRLLGIG
jgi:ferrous iron transport protein B